MVQNQLTLTLYWHPPKLWRGKRIWFYRFSHIGMWGISFRVLWFGFDLHNNSVWAFEDDTIRKARGVA
jgi:hypothetical protein